MKHEWKKKERQFYLPGNKPEIINVPRFKFLTIEGSGNPNDAFFANYIEVLYTLSYGVKMSPKKGITPQGFYDYTVYPLEGVWDLTEEGRNSFKGTIDKNQLVFKLMIRQPDFVDNHFATQIIDDTKRKKANPLFDKVKFEEITEGDCVQILHSGSYDNEAESFEMMEAFAEQNGLRRKSKTHREIYLSDARKVSPEKLKTVLRFNTEKLLVF